MPREMLRIVHDGRARGALVVYPPHWAKILDDGRQLALIVCLGADTAPLMYEATPGLRDPGKTLSNEAVVVYVEPVTAEAGSAAAEFATGHTGGGDSFLMAVNEISFLRVLLPRIRDELFDAYRSEAVELGTWPGVAVQPIIDGTRMFMVGHGAGGVLAYKIAALANPLLPGDPTFEREFSGLAVYGACAGGYARGDEAAAGVARQVWLPDRLNPSTVVDVLHVQGVADERYAAHDDLVAAAGRAPLADPADTAVMLQPCLAMLRALEERGSTVDEADALARWDVSAETSLAAWVGNNGLAQPTGQPAPLSPYLAVPGAAFGTLVSSSGASRAALLWLDGPKDYTNEWPDRDDVLLDELIIDFFEGSFP